MKAIDELRNHMKLMYDQGLAMMAMSTVKSHLNEIERELEEEYVALPKDADGETIHIGDRVENNERVARITLTDGSWEPSVYTEKAPCVLEEYFCNEVSHYHDPTVEDEIRSIVQLCFNIKERGERWSVDDVMQSGNVSDVVAKLQLREEGE